MTTSRPYRITYNGLQVGGRFSSVDAARRAVINNGAWLSRFPEPSKWTIEEVSRAPQTGALIAVAVARPFA